MRNNGQLTTDHGPLRAPAWFRYGVIALATIAMCSCTVPQPKYRVAGAGSATVRGQSPDAALPPASQARFEPKQLPTHLTAAQLKQAQRLPEGFQAAPCNHGGCACCSHGPVRGPSDEYLCDGGDVGMPAGVHADWSIQGLEQEDTIAHYDTIDGRTVVTPSNKVCIYAPRFAAIRQVVDPLAYARFDAAGGAVQKMGPVKIGLPEQAVASIGEIEPNVDRLREPPSLLLEKKHPGELGRDRRVAATIGLLAPYANVQLIRSGEVIGLDQVKVARASLAAITWAGDQAAQVVLNNQQAHADVSVLSPGTIYHVFVPNNPKLRLCKLASTGAALPGEEVEFTLRYDNIGDRVIGNVTIVDNLTTRLEYVEGSQKSSLQSNFSTERNEGDSLILRWEIIDPLPAGEGGVLQFRARVR